MLALDDQAFALVCIAAGRVPAEDRGRWLEDLADKLARKKRSRAEIQRTYRKRKRAGLMLLNVLVDDVAVPEALVQAGLLAPTQTDNSEAVAAAIEQMLSTIVSESLERYR